MNTATNRRGKVNARRVLVERADGGAAHARDQRRRQGGSCGPTTRPDQSVAGGTGQPDGTERVEENGGGDPQGETRIHRDLVVAPSSGGGSWVTASATPVLMTIPPLPRSIPTNSMPTSPISMRWVSCRWRCWDGNHLVRLRIVTLRDLGGVLETRRSGQARRLK